MYFRKHISLSYIALLIILNVSANVYSVEIVRLNVEYYDAVTEVVTNHTLDLELFSDVTPITVNNFLNYVTSGKYDGSFITRSVSGFILQSGRYTFRPPTPDNFLRPISENTGLALVPLESSSPVKNEYPLTTLTNVRGTISMAKLSHNPDSATNEWFINLADNRENLDNQNGGFTVFGRVIDNGMTIADEISYFPKHATIQNVINSSFSALPVVNYSLGDGILQENLVMISDATIITRPILSFSPNANTFPLDITGDASGSLQVITFTNTGNETLTISPISNTLSAEFTIESNNCNNKVLLPISTNPDSSCDLSIRFIATTESVINNSLDISYFSISSNYTVTLELTAEGVPATALLDVSEPKSTACYIDEFDIVVNANLCFLTTDQGGADSKTLIIKNKGGSDLTINSLSIDNTVDFSDDAGCTSSTVLAFNESCNLILTFAPKSVANFTATLDISSSAGAASRRLGGTGVNPLISVSSTITDFGEVIAGTSISKSIEIENSGSIGLILTTFIISGPDKDMFSLTTNCPDGAMDAAESCIINVTFSATSDGVKTATLLIDSNDAATPQYSVTLTGNSTIPNTPILNSSKNSIDFGSKFVDGSAADHVLTIENLGAGIITINSINIAGTDGDLFSIDETECSKELSTLNSCNLLVSFTPKTNGFYSSNITILTSNGDLNIPLSGTGIAPELIAPTEIDVGTSQINGLNAKQDFYLVNLGLSNLIVTDMSIAGTNNDLFSITNLCPINASGETILGSLRQCQIDITLSGLTAGTKTADLILTTNDPVNSTFTIKLIGGIDNDVDGILSSIEQLAPNNGDGNNDGIADENQNNVASFITNSNKGEIIITLASDAGIISKEETLLTDVEVLAKSPDEFPNDKIFDFGAFSFTVNSQLPGDMVVVGVYLPLDINAERFYRVGPTPDNIEPHLYDFTYSNETGLGAQILGQVSVIKKSGEKYTANLVLIRFVDGGLGDDDLTINGVIENGAGGFSIVHSDNNSSSGAMSLNYLLSIFLLLLARRECK